MSIVSVDEIREGRTSGRSKTAGESGKVEKTVTRTFRVIVSGPQDDPIDSEVAPSIPILGEVHPLDTSRRVSSISVAVNGDGSQHIVTVAYNSSTASGGGTSSDNPMDEPPSISWEQNTNTEPIYTLADGTAITNSAGQTFDPPITDEFTDPVLVVTQNLSNYSPGVAYQYANAVNSDFFYGPPGVAKLVSRTGSKEFRNDIKFWRVTTRIEFRDLIASGEWQGESAWGKLIVDEGMMQLDNTIAPPALPLKRILDSTGREVTSPVPLNGFGLPLNALTSSIKLVYVPPRKVKSFNALGLPSA